MNAEPTTPSQPPAIVLVAPQLGENIGAVARAMHNCGLGDLRLVAPRHGWPNPTAYPAASGADVVLDEAGVFDSTAAAVADLGVLYATTARLRDMVKPVLTPRQAAAAMRQEQRRCGVLFDPERTGLENDDVVRCQHILHVPLNPGFSSLNLAQAVLLIAYEWHLAGGAAPQERSPGPMERPATQAELDNFYEHLEDELTRGGFFAIEEKRPVMVRNIRNIFSRACLTHQEVRTLHGIVRTLAGRPKGGKQSRRD